MPDPEKPLVSPDAAAGVNLTPKPPAPPVSIPPAAKSTPVKKEVDVVAERKKADEKVHQKSEALTKANETCAKAHDELMQAQREAAQFPPITE